MKIIAERILKGGLLLFCAITLSSYQAEEKKPLQKTKKVSKKEITQSMIKAMRWQEDHPIFAKAPTDWTNGAYYTGVTRAHQSTGKSEFKRALADMAKRNDWQPYNRFYHADDLAICYSYLYLKTLGAKNVNLQPTSQFISDHLFKPHEWRDGSAGGDHKTLWYWCDALFMAPPVITFYSEVQNKKEYLDDMHKYYKSTYDLLFDQEEKLFARDLRFVWKGDSTDIKDGNGKKVFWSRGNGWVLGGLALMLDKMPQDYENRAFYVDLFKTMAARVKDLQPQDGLWRTSMLNPEGYDHGEVSGSGFFVFALAWGVNNGLLDKAEYLPAINKGWSAIAECQHDDGMVGWVQSIGAAPEPAKATSWQNYGTGAFLLAGSEIMKIAQ